MPESSPAPLPCGHDPDQLVDQVWEGHGRDLTEHQQSCPHCRERLARHRRAHALVTDLAKVRVQAPTGFAHRVMERVRNDDADEVAIHVGRTGTTSVSALVVELVATVAAHDVAGVTTVREIAAAGEALRMAVTVDLHRPIPDTVAELRATVSRTLRRLVGVAVRRIDVTVRDVGGS